MKQKIIVSTEQHKARACMIINSLPLDEPHEVVIRPHKRNRSAEQNAYMWLVETIMGAELGLTKEGMHDVHKREFLVPIFIRDDQDYAEMFFSIEQTPEPQRSILKREVVKLTSTTKANVAQMREFIDSILQQAGELGIRLPIQEY